MATMNRKAGYTLVEILLTIGILSIISGVAYVSYQDQTLRASKNDLKIHAELFASAVKNCISINGGWAIKLLDQSGAPSNNIVTPCEAKGNNQTELKEALKKKLDFTCPAEADCFTFTKINNAPRHQYHCLSIQKEVSGKKLQVLSRVSYKTPGEYQIWCGENLSSYLRLESGTCKKSEFWSAGPNLTAKGFKKDNDCWK